MPVTFTSETSVTSVSSGPFETSVLDIFMSAPPRPERSWPFAEISAVCAAASSLSKTAVPLYFADTGPTLTVIVPLYVRSSVFSVIAAPGSAGATRYGSVR